METLTKNLTSPFVERQYSSVDDLIKGESVSPETQQRIAEIQQQTRVTVCLAKMRQRAGITQERLAEVMNVTQSAISKLEAGVDFDLTLGEVAAYAKATKQTIGLTFGKPPTHAELVKQHVMAVKSHLDSLAKIANQYEELEADITNFFGEACFNIMSILAKCTTSLPNGGKNANFEIRVEADKGDRPKSKDLADKACSPVLVA